MRNEIAQKLQDEYDACYSEIEMSSTAICMGVNVEHNKNNNKKCLDRIRAIKIQADQLGVTLLSHRERYM